MCKFSSGISDCAKPNTIEFGNHSMVVIQMYGELVLCFFDVPAGSLVDG